MPSEEIEKRIQREIEREEFKDMSDKKKDIYMRLGKDKAEKLINEAKEFFEINKKEIIRDGKVSRKLE
tara:strand:+ start:944 stop:1147 length:204 start_codon:yes stop_codon:yes gene_type:complete